MSEIIFPEKLYKYRIWGDKYHRKILTHNEVYFTSIANFNDPFEGVIPIRYDLLTDKEVLILTKRLLRKKYPFISSKEAKRKAERKLRKAPNKPYQNREESMRLQYEYRKKNFGIFSLTEDPYNIVMWSLYADSHKGFCVGFNTTRLVNCLGYSVLTEPCKVEYVEEFPIIKVNLSDDPEYIKKSLITKSKQWVHEKEWRLISLEQNKTNFPIKIGPRIICEVILGCRISEQDKQEIIMSLSQRGYEINLFEAAIKDSEFGLSFQKLDI